MQNPYTDASTPRHAKESQQEISNTRDITAFKESSQFHSYLPPQQHGATKSVGITTSCQLHSLPYLKTNVTSGQTPSQVNTHIHNSFHVSNDTQVKSTSFIIIIIIINISPLTARVVGAPQIILQPISSIFPCSPLPFGTWQTPSLPIP